MEVGYVRPDHGRADALYRLALPERLAELRGDRPDASRLRRVEISEVVNVTPGRHEQMTKVRPWIGL